MIHFTFSMIKPEAVQQGHVGEILTKIERAGFTIQALQKTQLHVEKARAFYAVHQQRPFYEAMCRYMASGSIIAMVLEKENAVVDFRILIGATNPIEAAVGTIRRQFGTSIEANAIHGTDAEATVRQEIAFFFPELIEGDR